MNQLMGKVDEWCKWSGMQVNIKKTRVTAASFLHAKSLDTTGGVHAILYRGQALPNIPAKNSFKYLGVRLSLLHGTKDEMNYVISRTTLIVNCVEKHIYQPRPLNAVVQNMCHSVFRYSAPCVTWADTKLNQLYDIWCRGQKFCWSLVKSQPLVVFQHESAMPIIRPEVI